MFAKSPPVLVPGTAPESREESATPSPEKTPLQSAVNPMARRYGSFVGTPPDEPTLPERMGTLTLPGPAMQPSAMKRALAGTLKPATPQRLQSNESNVSNVSNMSNVSGGSATAHEEGDPSPMTLPEPRTKHASFSQRLFQRNQQTGSQRQKHHTFSRTKLRKMFKPHSQSPYIDELQMEAYEKLDAAQGDFFSYLDNELQKVGDFYKMKEDEATERLQLLRTQLHELRDRRLQEVQEAKDKQKMDQDRGILGEDASHLPNGTSKGGDHHHNGSIARALRPLDNVLQGKPNIGRVTKSLQQNTSPQGPVGQRDESRQDYTRRKDEAPSYRIAKRKLKLALQEYYRGLELLKSYALLNRTAFRKINKKYDKAVNARPTMRYYSEKVENAHFVKSDVISGHIVAVEDLYSRYFEKGNHKVAAAKLRSQTKGADQSSSSFRNGLYLAAGACFGISGMVRAFDRLLDSDPKIHIQTSYLLQLYAGYFLANLLFLLFTLNCKVWVMNRINYAFVFEYDTRHILDWRQLAELPCFFFALNAFIFWLNFIQHPTHEFWLYWFIILIVITLLIMALPFRIFYYPSRRWWGYSNWRLFFAGLYPVEFRDFYLGDMYCSSTYSMGQIELFFCLYINNWNNPGQCNSTHSRLLGFFAALPAVWRSLQCLRRYKDSGNWFPHLANCAKYGCNILYYMSLSLYRIDHTVSYKGVFITFAIINGIYCSVWDIFMDWSLGNWWCSNFFLRERLAFKKKRFYYIAMVLDAVLRQQWIAYAIFTEDVQHSSLASFIVALAEVLRRGMWSLFRVENEHCNNVEHFRASRDIPLPYKISGDSTPRQSQDQQAPSGTISATGTDIERLPTTDSSLRHRRTPMQTPTVRALQRVGTAIAAAHAQDFEKKRKPVEGSQEEEAALTRHDSSDDEGDDNDNIIEEEDEADIQAVRGATHSRL